MRKAFKEGLNVKPKDEHQLWCSNPRQQEGVMCLGGDSIHRADKVSSDNLQPVLSNGREVDLPVSPLAPIPLCWDPLFTFSVAFTGFWSLAQSK